MTGADITSGCTIDSWTEGSKKVLWVETAATADATDYITIVLATYGAKTLEAVDGWVHTTTDSIVTVERMTTEVTTGTMVATIPSGTDNDKRIAKFYFDC